jgi:putative oxidoreductase
MGLLFMVSSLGYFFNLMPQPELNESAKAFVMGMFATGYLFPLVKVIELLCGIAFIAGRFVPLATVVIFPITINILLFHTFLAPGILMPVLIFMGNLLLAFYYRRNYEMVLSFK